ncbi:hypothetical protein GJ496_007467 [Pomphorhynchus laevis]|nr:hypothetical protein GJ496_007467 [Pomphorhynchus laevis]
MRYLVLYRIRNNNAVKPTDTQLNKKTSVNNQNQVTNIMIKKPFQVIKRLTKSCQTTKTPNESKTAPPSAPGNETELVRPGYLPEINPGAKGFISAVHPYGSPEARYHAQIGRDPRIVPYTYGEQHVNAPSYLPHPEERIENYYACPSCGYKMSFPQELLDEVCNQIGGRNLQKYLYQIAVSFTLLGEHLQQF